MSTGSRLAHPSDRPWAIIVDSEPAMLSYLARALMFFQPSYRVASAAEIDHLTEWMTTRHYDVAVLGCLGNSALDGRARNILAPVGAVVSLACPHMPAALPRPPRLSALLEQVRISSGQPNLTIDLRALTGVSAPWT